MNFAYCGQEHLPKTSYNDYGYYYGFHRTPSPIPIAKTCPPGWILYPGPFSVCIFRSIYIANWDAADAKCRAMGSILAEPRTRAEVSFVTGEETHLNYFIGIRVASNCVATYASSGLPVPKELWHYHLGSYPKSCPSYPCGWTYRRDELVNGDCKNKHFVCQMPLGGYTPLR